MQGLVWLLRHGLAIDAEVRHLLLAEVAPEDWLPKGWVLAKDILQAVVVHSLLDIELEWLILGGSVL